MSTRNTHMSIAKRGGLLLAAGVVALLVAVPALVSAQASPSQWRSTLIGANEVPPVTSASTGIYEATLNEAAQTITWALTVPTITNATAAHLHFGAPTCACPVVLPMFAAPAGSPASIINVSGTSGPGNLTGPLAGKWDDFVTALKAGQIYVNAHTTQNPGGEVRGTLVLASAAQATATVTATPTVTLVASGNLGAPPTTSWNWRIGDLTVAPGAIQGPHRHNQGVFYVLEGTEELDEGGTIVRYPAGTGHFIANQVLHSHRPFPANSSVRILLVRVGGGDADVAPSAAPVRDLLISGAFPTTPGQGYALQARAVDAAPFTRTAEQQITNPSVIYVVTGTLTIREGSSARTVPANSAVQVPLNARLTFANDTASQLRYVAVEVVPGGPAPLAAPAAAPAPPKTGNAGLVGGRHDGQLPAVLSLTVLTVAIVAGSRLLAAPKVRK